MYIYSLLHVFYIKNTQTTIFMTRFHDNNWTLSLNFDYFFHEMSQKVHWLKEYCKYIISMKFGDSMTLISNFGKMPIFTKLYMPVSLHVLVCQAQNFDQWWIIVPALQIFKELENHCPTLRDMGNEICVIFVKMKSWQNAKFLELSAPYPFSASTLIPMNFDQTISKCYYVQLQLLLTFHVIQI